MMRGFDSIKRQRGWLVLALGALLLQWNVGREAQAETFRLENPNDTVVGFPFYFTARSKDTLMDIARQNNLGYADMRQANPKVDMWVPGEGAEVLVPSFYVLPNVPHVGIIINRAEKRLYYFPPGQASEVQIFAISVGRDAMGTPLGSFKIIEKKKDPIWTPGPNVRASHAARGDILPAQVMPGPENPLGRFAMRLSNPDYLIHGTSMPWGMGMEVSGGCIRMYPEGVEKLFGQVSVDTPVAIIDQPYKLGWRGDELYLEVQTGEKSIKRSARAVISGWSQAEGAVIDWAAAERAVKEDTGVPQVVGRRSHSGDKSYLPMIF
ncbi:L,D-transpeptidase family protein [Chromatium okenii]|nr:L,D-transpeptidase family protein [Chromatium okenii]